MDEIEAKWTKRLRYVVFIVIAAVVSSVMQLFWRKDV